MTTTSSMMRPPRRIQSSDRPDFNPATTLLDLATRTSRRQPNSFTTWTELRLDHCKDWQQQKSKQVLSSRKLPSKSYIHQQLPPNSTSAKAHRIKAQTAMSNMQAPRALMTAKCSMLQSGSHHASAGSKSMSVMI